ncbi:MAG: flagellar hook-associated protein FlgK [Burkholderiales bacterium]|nr:MAG: flagellar hook-associated protein FlgK [Burkholderiales bacterium]
MSDLMRIGSSAMNAAYAQLQTTGQNIANASTPGYVRREVVLTEAGSNDSSGYVGRGVDVTAVRRVYDEFLVRESVSSRAAAAQDSARAESLGRLDTLFSDPQSGLGASFDELVAAFTDVTARPTDPAARSTVLTRAETFAARASRLDTQLLEMRDSAQGRMQSEVANANQALQGLAAINRRIDDASGNGGQPNALLDQRDKLLGDLNASLRANATIGSDGTITVTSQRGEPLVVGGTASRLVLNADALDPSKRAVSVVRGNGVTLPMDAGQLGGTLAGLMKFSNDDIDAARAQIGRITASVSGAFNAQQALGLDMSGTPGQPMFSVGAATVSGASTNLGTAQFGVAVVDPKALKASDYEIGFDGTQYSVTRLSDGVVTNFASMPQTFDGLTLSLGSGTPTAEDRFLVRSATAFASGAKSLLTNGQRLATAMPVVTEPGAGNTGDLKVASLDIASIGATTGATVTITFTGPNTFSVNGAGTGNPSGLSYTPGMQLSFNGWSMKLDGAPAAGDTLRVSATPNPAADNRNARVMQALGDGKLADGATVIGRYAEMIGDIGARTQGARSQGDMSQRLYEDAERARTEMSGVNLDEEAARLMQYQQAYQAAAKVIAAANEMFRSLLEAAG